MLLRDRNGVPNGHLGLCEVGNLPTMKSQLSQLP